MNRTYVDAGVLIAAARARASIAIRALEILDDPGREFASSIFVKLEVLPKAIFHKNTAEVEFYETFFDAVAYWAHSLETVAEDAYKQACYSGLAAMDALHLAAALSLDAAELVTTERPGKPIHRAQSIKVISIWEQ